MDLFNKYVVLCAVYIYVYFTLFVQIPNKIVNNFKSSFPKFFFFIKEQFDKIQS